MKLNNILYIIKFPLSNQKTTTTTTAKTNIKKVKYNVFLF